MIAWGHMWHFSRASAFGSEELVHGDMASAPLHVGSDAGEIGMPLSGGFAGRAEYNIDLSFSVSGRCTVRDRLSSRRIAVAVK